MSYPLPAALSYGFQIETHVVEVKEQSVHPEYVLVIIFKRYAQTDTACFFTVTGEALSFPVSDVLQK